MEADEWMSAPRIAPRWERVSERASRGGIMENDSDMQGAFR